MKISIFDEINDSYHAGKPGLPHTVAELDFLAGEKTTTGSTLIKTDQF